jgi:hypothetical protein
MTHLFWPRAHFQGVLLSYGSRYEFDIPLSFVSSLYVLVDQMSRPLTNRIRLVHASLDEQKADWSWGGYVDHCGVYFEV